MEDQTKIGKIQELLKYLGWILLFFFLWLKGCSNETKPQILKVEIPEIKNNFPSQKPASIEIVEVPVFIKGDNIEKVNPLNQKLLAENEVLKNKFEKSDSLNKKLMFENQIKINSFSSKFEDENLLIDINGVVRGEVEEITPSYTIKKKTVDVLLKPKETAFRLLGGIEVGNNIRLDNFNMKANLFFQNKKGNQLSMSADNNKVFYVGYAGTIFSIKK